MNLILQVRKAGVETALKTPFYFNNFSGIVYLKVLPPRPRGGWLAAALQFEERQVRTEVKLMERP